MTGAGRLTLFVGGIVFAAAAAVVRWLSGHDPDLARLMAAPRDDEPLTKGERAAVEEAFRTRTSPEPLPEGSRP